MPLNSKTTA